MFEAFYHPKSHFSRMKKVVLFAGLLLGTAASGNAQTRLGAKGGLGLSKSTGSNSDNFKNYSCLGGGLMVDIAFSDLLSLHPELLFSQKGTQYEVAIGNYTSATETGKVRLNYLDLPVLLRVKASGFFFEFGPQLGVLLGRSTARFLTVPGGGPLLISTSTNTVGARNVDFGYVAGLGYQLPEGFEFGLRYNGGLLDLSDPSSSDKNYNSVFQVQVGYLIPTK